jgi:uncharacterized membrane protein
MSANGDVLVGWTYGTSSLQEAYSWTAAGGIQLLGDLQGGEFASAASGASANGSIIVGFGTSASGTEAARWTGSSVDGLGDLDGGQFQSHAFAVSNDGSVIVGRGTSALGNEAVRWVGDAAPEGLGHLPGGLFSSEAIDVSADGSIIVGVSRFSAAADDSAAFIWDETHGMRELQAVLALELGLDLTGWQLTEALGISADGLTVVGRGINPAGDPEGWIAFLPEPTTALLLACGLVGLGAGHGRRLN